MMLTIYRALLRLYPASYRRDYAEPMEQAFRDQLRANRSCRGRLLAAGLWDLVSSAAGLRWRLQPELCRWAIFVGLNLTFLVLWAFVPSRPLIWFTAAIAGFIMGCLDPMREWWGYRQAGFSRFFRWSFALFFVQGLALTAEGQYFNGFPLAAMIGGRLGALLQFRRHPEWGDPLQWQRPGEFGGFQSLNIERHEEQPGAE